MISPSRILHRFQSWFEQPDSPVPLGWFRIAIAGFCLIRLFVVRQSILDLYGQYGFIQWAITRGNLSQTLPHIGNFALLLSHIGVSPNETVYLIIAIYVAALALLLVGIASRSVAALAWVVDLFLMYASSGLLYGMDYFAHIGLFYCMIMPVGNAVSLSCLCGWRNCKPSVAAGVTRRMLQMQICIVYTSSGLEKASGLQWWNGEAIWRALTLPIFRQFDFSWVAHAPWLAMVAGWSVLVLECGYAGMMWCRRIRKIWFVLIVGMHCGIALCMGMWLFAVIMIILNCGAFGHEVWMDFANARLALRSVVEAGVKARFSRRILRPSRAERS